MKPNFINYPVAKEAPCAELQYEQDKNPVARGYALPILSSIVCWLPPIQRQLWINAGFGQMPEHIDAADLRFKPSVTPVSAGESASPAASMAELTAPPPSSASASASAASSPGRFYSAADYHRLYQSGDATPLQVAEALLPLVQPRGGQGPNKFEAAWIACNEEGVLTAARASTDRWAAGKPLGVLDGVPFSVKCDTPVEGYMCTWGIKVDARWPFCYKDKICEETAWPVRKLMEAGAVMVGQNNMHEIGMDTTGLNSAVGTPINWFNKSYYPGGSSSGGGSTLGAGLVPIAVGTDAGGSVRIPASFNGVYGLKVTHDRTMTMSSTMCVTGPLAATASDLAVAFRVMAQPDPDCPVQGLFAPTSVPSSPVTKKKIIGVPRQWIDWGTTQPVKDAFNAALTYFKEKEGYEVVDITLPLLREGQLAHAATCLAESVETMRERVDASKGQHFIHPLTHPNRILLSIGQHTTAADYVRYGKVRQAIMSHLAFLWAKEKYGPEMLVLTPTTPTAGWPVHPGDQAFGCTDGNRSILNMRFVWLANTTGCPATTAPMGYADPEQGVGNVPMGIMAMAEWGGEELLLEWAALMERYLHSMPASEAVVEGGGYAGGRKRPDEWVDVLTLAKSKVMIAQKLADTDGE